LKPAVEIIVVFQKPYRGKPVECITRTGAGALNIDGSRIGTDGGGTHCNNRGDNGRCLGHNNAGKSTSGETIHGEERQGGRWAANFIVSHHPDCVYISDNGASRWACVAECAVRRLDEQSGISGNRKEVRLSRKRKGFMLSGSENNVQEANAPDQYGDTGGASRFFFNVAQQIDEADPVYYCAKASRRERDAGCEGMPLKLVNPNYGKGGFARPTDMPEREIAPFRNSHPCCKPLSLTRYLATLLLPPAEYAPRRIFVPFAGVASEAIGAMQAGWEEVVGVERETEYVEIAKARLAYWLRKQNGFDRRGLC
jgi:site-specific DNA-methyltransferase (adenine-specific)